MATLTLVDPASAAPATTGTGAATVSRLRATFDAGRTRPLAWRRAQLEALGRLVAEREEEILAAVRADLGKGRGEAQTAEVGFLLSEVKHALSNLERWTKPAKVATPLAMQPGRSRVVREPLGVVLIVGAWNFPFQLSLSPLVGALAAGNCAVLKPSELAPRSSALIAQAVPRYLDPDAVAVVEGGAEPTADLLEQPFDHVFYTGGARVARIVMAAAAKHLTPVTLELGGKSPCYVHEDADLEVAARRIVWGKFMNAGQVCIAPDYVLVARERKDALLEALKGAIARFYGPDPRNSADYGRIVNARHFDRLAALMEGGIPAVGGGTDRELLYIAPTVLTGVDPDSPLMREEIFGPLLPVLPVAGVEAALRFVKARPKPLAAYVFARDAAAADRFEAETSSGALLVNDTIMHQANPNLPFGGVGESGMGAYHGKLSFELFSHAKAVMRRATWIDPDLRYPPYTPAKMKALRRLV